MGPHLPVARRLVPGERTALTGARRVLPVIEPPEARRSPPKRCLSAAVAVLAIFATGVTPQAQAKPKTPSSQSFIAVGTMAISDDPKDLMLMEVAELMRRGGLKKIEPVVSTQASNWPLFARARELLVGTRSLRCSVLDLGVRVSAARVRGIEVAVLSARRRRREASYNLFPAALSRRQGGAGGRISHEQGGRRASASAGRHGLRYPAPQQDHRAYLKPRASRMRISENYTPSGFSLGPRSARSRNSVRWERNRGDLHGEWAPMSILQGTRQ